MKASDQKFEILKMVYERQTQYLQWLSEIDFKIFTGILTVQLIFGGWLSKYEPATQIKSMGLLLIDFSLVSLACALLVLNQKRRMQEVEKLANIADALRLTETGIFLDGKKLATRPKSRPSLWPNLVAIFASFVGIVLLVIKL